MLHRLCALNIQFLRTPFCRTYSERTWGRSLNLKCGLASSVTLGNEVREGFRLVRSKPIPELQLEALHFHHDKSGANFFHFEKDDSNCVFAVGFKTPVNSGNGLPHILEHSTLCGSEKYPVRDPFFKMLNRSLATYMNAWTASDYTLYPFASQNKDDYFNLLDVYMDAVFFPKLEFHDFAQEGWRLEHEDPKDVTSPIVFKGVVFSEMKGAMSDAASLVHSYLQEHLMKGSIYAHNSGGNPKEIVCLTWPELLSFHRKYYQPSNAKFFSYGNLDLIAVLSKVNAVLNKAHKPLSTESQGLNLSELSSLQEPTTIYRTCALDPMGDPEKQVRASLSFLTNDAKDTFTSFAFRVLGQLLLDGSSSPMHKALIDSGLAPDYSPIIGYDNSIRQTSFSVGVQGIHKRELKKVQKTIWSVLNECAEKGFSKESLDAILQQIELGLKQVTAHFGLGLVQSVSSGQFQGVDLFDALAIDENLKRLREEASAGLFQKLIRTYLLDNPRWVFLVVQPDPSFPERQEKELSRQLDAQIAKLTETEKERIYESGLALLQKQQTRQDLSVLPCLDLEKISPLTKTYPWERHEQDYSIFSRAANTNGISYIKGFTKVELPEHLNSYLPLFCGALTWLGTQKKTMAELDQEIKAHTGGIAAYPILLRDPTDLNRSQTAIGFSGNAMSHNFSHLLSLMQELLFETNFDLQDRLKTLISRNFTSMVNSIPDSGHRYARSLAASMLQPVYKVPEMWNGLTQIQFLHQIQNAPIETTIEAFKSIAKAFSRNKTKFAVITQGSAMSESLKHVHQFAQNFPITSPVISSFSSKWNPLSKRIFVPTPFPVHYCAMVTSTVPYTDAHSVPLQLLAHILMFQHLHGTVREQGGAYGAHASLDPLSGLFGFSSYRDPQHRATFAQFQDSCKLPLRTQALVEAKFSLYGQLDRPLDVDDQGLAEFLGLDPDAQQFRRDLLRSTAVANLEEARRLWLLPQLGDRRHDPAFASVLLGPATLSAEYEKEGWSVLPVELS